MTGELIVLNGNKQDEYRVIKKLPGHSDRCWDMRYSPMNTYLGSAGDDKAVIIRNAYSYKVPHPSHTHHLHSDSLTSRCSTR